MRLDHKPGSDYGIDYGVVLVYLLWIAATLALLVTLAVRSQGQAACAWSIASISVRDRARCTQVRLRDPAANLECRHPAHLPNSPQERRI